MKVIGVGDNVVDVYLDRGKMYPGGNALNFSVYAKQLGYDSAFLGVFGDDDAGTHIHGTLKQLDIDTSRCRTLAGESGHAVVDIRDGDRVFIGSNGGGVSVSDPVKLLEADLEYLAGFNVVHTSCFSAIEPELPKLSSLPVPVSFDFSDKRHTSYLEKVCPHIDFAFLSCGEIGVTETAELLRSAVELGCEVAVATRGEAGAVACVSGEFYHKTISPVVPVDTLGAGDSFITKFLLTMLSYENHTEGVIEEAMEGASRFAAATCLVEGAFGKGIAIPGRVTSYLRTIGGKSHD